MGIGGLPGAACSREDGDLLDLLAKVTEIEDLVQKSAELSQEVRDNLCDAVSEVRERLALLAWTDQHYSRLGHWDEVFSRVIDPIRKSGLDEASGREISEDFGRIKEEIFQLLASTGIKKCPNCGRRYRKAKIKKGKKKKTTKHCPFCGAKV